MNLINVLADSFQCAGVEVPNKIVNISSSIITLLKFGIPVLLIIFGMLDLGKAVIASKEDEIKKGQQMFIKRIISAVLVFFVVVVVQLVVDIAADASDKQNGIADCINAFVKGVDVTGNVNK